jgi:arylsulfatase A-like enzyme
MNLVLVILDSFRKDHIGAYGNPWIHTPHLDAIAKESVLFTEAYPESLPTLPVRRALHTGQRVYPFHGHRNFKGDFVGAPGWGPINEEQDTLSELLSEDGYRTAFITDTYHQFKPSKNFHRGFDEWVWIRGQETDRYLSGPKVSEEAIAARSTESQKNDEWFHAFMTTYLRNNAYRMTEKDYYPARLFAEASRWIWENQSAEKFFLVVDSFDPHEPWDPPEHYRRMYDPDDDCKNVIQSPYRLWRERLTERELKRVQANYAGECTMVDRWFGFFLESLQNTGRLDDTLVVIVSDHGHNVGHDPGDKGLVSKQGHPMTKAVAQLVCMIRHPKGEGAGTKCDKLIYNMDLSATMLALAGVEPKQRLDGINVWDAIRDTTKPLREYVTVAWGPLVTVVDETWWYNASIWGEGARLYRHKDDPHLETNLAESRPEICTTMLARAVADAGGSIPEAFKDYATKPGCTPYLGKD